MADRTFLTGAEFLGGTGGPEGALLRPAAAPALNLTSAFSKNSRTLALRMSSNPSRTGANCRSPRIFISRPSDSALADRTGSNESPVQMERASDKGLIESLDGASRVFLRQRLRNRRVPSLT